MEWSGKSGLKWDRLLTVTLGVSGEIEIWKMGKIRKIFETCDRKKKTKKSKSRAFATRAKKVPKNQTLESSA